MHSRKLFFLSQGFSERHKSKSVFLKHDLLSVFISFKAFVMWSWLEDICGLTTRSMKKLPGCQDEGVKLRQIESLVFLYIFVVKSSS